jgi:hypothetical protein
LKVERSSHTISYTLLSRLLFLIHSCWMGNRRRASLLGLPQRVEIVPGSFLKEIDVRRIIALAAVLILPLLAACDAFKVTYGETYEQQLKNMGVLGSPKELRRLDRFQSVNGILIGSFFMGSGTVTGQVNSGMSLMFYWEPKPGIVVPTTLPYSRFKFIIDESRDVPTVEFVFLQWYLDRKDRQRGPTPPPPLSDRNLNSYVESDRLEVVLVRISQATMEKEVFLPRP